MRVVHHLTATRELCPELEMNCGDENNTLRPGTDCRQPRTSTVGNGRCVSPVSPRRTPRRPDRVFYLRLFSPKASVNSVSNRADLGSAKPRSLGPGPLWPTTIILLPSPMDSAPSTVEKPKNPGPPTTIRSPHGEAECRHSRIVDTWPLQTRSGRDLPQLFRDIHGTRVFPMFLPFFHFQLLRS